jgi:hypothetical protein
VPVPARARAKTTPDLREQYQAAVERAWADQKLEEAEEARLSAFATRLGLTEEVAAAIERSVIGDTREAVFRRQKPDVGGLAPSVLPSRVVRTLRGHTNAVRSVAFSPDGRLLP